MRAGMLWMLLLASRVCLAAPAEVSFFNWSDYLPGEVLERFTAETGIRVRYSTYDSNEAMYAKLKLLSGQGYDLIVPSTYFIDRMGKEGLLRPLDRSQLPNFRFLDARHLDKPFDPGNRYSVPYLWGTTGIALDTRHFDPGQVKAWADLWRPEFHARLLLSNDMREVFHIGLRVLGYPGNSTDPEQIRQAYEKLRSLMPNVRLFNSDAPLMLYVTGEVDAGMTSGAATPIAPNRKSPASSTSTLARAAACGWTIWPFLPVPGIRTARCFSSTSCCGRISPD